MHRRTWVSSWPRRGKAAIPSPISEDGKPVAAVINIDDLADLQDRAALAALRNLARIRSEDKDLFTRTRRAVALLAEQPYPEDAVAWGGTGGILS